MPLPPEHRPTQIGLIVLQADQTLERDMRVLLPKDVEYLVSRIPSGQSVTVDSLQAMDAALTQAASLLPCGVELAAVAYGCTSGTAQIGVGRIASLVQAGVSTPVVTEPVSALIAACRTLKVTRIGLVSPYIASVSDRLRAVLGDAGIDVTRFISFDEPIEEKVVRIPPDVVMQAAVEVGQNSDCDAVFLSCTNLRTLDVIEPIEAQLNKPVLSSNQVLAWHLGELAGLKMSQSGVGTLFKQNT
jgi:maleate isomerase